MIRVRNALLAPPLSARTVTRESPASSNCASAVPGTIMWSAVLLAVALPGSSSPEAASPPAPVEPWSTNQRSVWDPNGRPNAEAALYFSERGRDHSRIRPRSPGPADGSGTGAPRRFPRAGCCWMLAVRATYPAVANRSRSAEPSGLTPPARTPAAARSAVMPARPIPADASASASTDTLFPGRTAVCDHHDPKGRDKPPGSALSPQPSEQEGAPSADEVSSPVPATIPRDGGHATRSDRLTRTRLVGLVFAYGVPGLAANI